MRLIGLTRLIAVFSIVACSLAVVVARSAPRGAVFHLQADAHQWPINGPQFWPVATKTQAYDLETGTLSSLPAPTDETLQWASFSEWVDDQGEWQVAGRWVALQRDETGLMLGNTGLGRFAFPSGRPLDRIPNCPLPYSAPCWYPGPSPRVLFPGTDGTLYECTFSRSEPGTPRREPSVRPLSWSNIPGVGPEPTVAHVIWPKGLNGYLIACMRTPTGVPEVEPIRLWWLRLSPNGMILVDAGRLCPDDDNRGSSINDQFPTVVTLPDGGHLLAYQRRLSGPTSGELCVAPIRIDRQTGAPTVAASEIRSLATEICGVPVAFSSDRTSIHAIQQRKGEGPAVRRFARDGIAP